MKAIIPVAGAGTHLRPFTYTQPKALIPVAGKPIIKYIIDDLCSNGITEFVFIVGYLGDKIIDYIQNNYSNLKQLKFYRWQYRLKSQQVGFMLIFRTVKVKRFGNKNLFYFL